MLPCPGRALKAACQGSLISSATSCWALGRGLAGWGGPSFASHPVAQRLWITCAGESTASCSISASSPGDVCERFWPAAQPAAPTPASIRQHTKRKGAQCCFSVASLIFRSDACPIFPSLHLLRAQHRTVPTRRRGLWLLPRQTGDPSARLGSGCRICSRLSPSAQQHRCRWPQTGTRKRADGCARALCW